MTASSSRSEWCSKWKLWIDYLGPHGDWCRRELMDRAILAMLGRIRGKSILDAGCGEGRLTRILAQRGAAAMGIDIVPEFIKLANATAEDNLPCEATRRWPWLSGASGSAHRGTQSFRVADLARLPREFSGEYDAAVCCCSLNHVSDLSRAVVSLERTLKADGFCVVVLPNPYHVLPCGKVKRRRSSSPSITFAERISPKLTITNVYRSFSAIVNAFAKRGMTLDCVEEPLLKPAARRRWAAAISALRRARKLPDPATTPWFLIMRFRKVTP